MIRIKKKVRQNPQPLRNQTRSRVREAKNQVWNHLIFKGNNGAP
jgi:hypothetical protein